MRENYMLGTLRKLTGQKAKLSSPELGVDLYLAPSFYQDATTPSIDGPKVIEVNQTHDHYFSMNAMHEKQTDTT